MKIFYSSKLENVYESWDHFVRVMTEEMGLPEDTLVLRDQNRKPFFPDHPDLHFSITHTKNHWLCVFADTPVGIDAELGSRKIANREKITERFFSPAEQTKIKESDRPESEFISLWTKKEACLKVNGLGVLKDMNSIDTESPDFDMHVKQMIMLIDNEKDQLMISVCSKEDAGDIDIKVLA